MTASQPCAVGIDLGGTRIKAGLVEPTGRVRARRTVATEAEGGPDHVLERIAAVASELAAAARAEGCTPVGVVVGAPGALSQRRGIVYAPPNLPGWRDVPICTHLQQRTGLIVRVENDANAAALGECRFGAGRGLDQLVMITLGTGVGSGVILDGRILHGHFETAGELGHTIVQPGGRACGCGQHGCLEAYASATNVARRVAEAITDGAPSACTEVLRQRGDLSAADVAAAVRAGDALAARVWDEACRYLAIACVNVQHLLNPQAVILAGGMAAAGDILLDGVRRHFQEQTWPLINDRPDIRLGELGDDAGFLGAASLAFE